MEKQRLHDVNQEWPADNLMRQAARPKSRNTFRLGRIFGIEIGLDWTWFIVFTLITWTLSTHYFPMNYSGWSLGLYWLLGLSTSLLFFGSVLAHELSHSLVARSFGTSVRAITLFIFGGVAHIAEEPKRPRDEFWMSLAGPGMSLALAFLFGVIWLSTRAISEPLGALAFWLGWINLVIAGFNLIPGFPLDGGRVFRSIIWGITGDLRRATRVASFAGRVVGYLFILGGILLIFRGLWINGIWIAFIGWFLESAAASSYRQVALRDELAGYTVQEVMMVDCPRVAADLTLEEVVQDYVLRSGRRCFPVSDGERILGYVTLDAIKEVPREKWGTTTVNQVKLSFNQVKAADPSMGLFTVLELLSSEGKAQLPVLEGSKFLGMITRDNVVALARARGELGI